MGIVRVRQERLLASVRRTGRARLQDLAAELEVSSATLRRDVADLAARGLLLRSHGQVEVIEPLSGRQRRGAVGIIAMPYRHEGYISAFVNAAKQEIERRNMRCVLEVGDDESSGELVAQMVSAGCVGIVYIPQWYSRSSEETVLPWALRCPVPVVLTEREVGAAHPLFELDSVVTDHRAGLVLALRHLRDLGHRRILTVVEQDSPTTRILRASDSSVRDELDLEPGVSGHRDDLLVLDPSLEVVDRWQLIAERIRTDGVTAMFVHNDHLALSLVSDLRRHGIVVPDDLSVVAYDDLVGPVGAVPLTTVAPPKQGVAREAVALVARRHRQESGGGTVATAHLRLVPRLTIRASTTGKAGR